MLFSDGFWVTLDKEHFCFHQFFLYILFYQFFTTFKDGVLKQEVTPLKEGEGKKHYAKLYVQDGELVAVNKPNVPQREKTYLLTYPRSLIRVFNIHMKKLCILDCPNAPSQDFRQHYENMPIQVYWKFHHQKKKKKWKFSGKKFKYFSYFSSKHRLWVLDRTASARRF